MVFGGVAKGLGFGCLVCNACVTVNGVWYPQNPQTKKCQALVGRYYIDSNIPNQLQTVRSKFSLDC